MSESSNEPNEPNEPGQGDRETPDVGLIPDEDLPEDLQPEENPLARDPDGSDAGKVEGMPDMGGPGAA